MTRAWLDRLPARESAAGACAGAAVGGSRRRADLAQDRVGRASLLPRAARGRAGAGRALRARRRSTRRTACSSIPPRFRPTARRPSTGGSSRATARAWPGAERGRKRGEHAARPRRRDRAGPAGPHPPHAPRERRVDARRQELLSTRATPRRATCRRGTRSTSARSTATCWAQDPAARRARLRRGSRQARHPGGRRGSWRAAGSSCACTWAGRRASSGLRDLATAGRTLRRRRVAAWRPFTSPFPSTMSCT